MHRLVVKGLRWMTRSGLDTIWTIVGVMVVDCLVSMTFAACGVNALGGMECVLEAQEV